MTDSLTRTARNRKTPAKTPRAASRFADEKTYRLTGIDEVNKNIPLPLLKHVYPNNRNIEPLRRNGRETVGDLCECDLSREEYSIIVPAKEFLSVSVIDHFREMIDSQNDNARISLLRRGAGATLQEIGNELRISRERVRQISAKTCRQLKGAAELIAGVMFSTHDGVFTSAELHRLLGSRQLTRCCQLVLKESNYIRQFNFSNKTIRADLCPPEPERSLAVLVREVIGEGANFPDKTPRLESGLQEASLWFFDLTDVKNFLVREGYYFYGDYVAKGKQSYSSVCCDAIKKYYSFDVKLDDDDNNEDMKRLREIIAEHYQGVSLPSSNKAVTSAITRDTSRIVLSGRGRYCPLEKVELSDALIKDIYQFIKSKRQTTFYYSELFAHFKNRLLRESNVHNYNFLHGMLKCLYPDEFVYERDMLIKNDSQRMDFNHRLSLLLKQHGRAMSKTEICKTIRGINSFVITYAAIRLPEIIKWDYNEFNHIGNLVIKPADADSLEAVLLSQLKANYGYCSDTLLYNAALKKIRGFMKRNDINNARNLFYVADHLFGDKYRFRKPHIVVADFPVQDLSVVNIARALLKSGGFLNHDEYQDLAKKLGWAGGTLHAVFYELKIDYVRISENDYVRKDYFKMTKKAKRALSLILQERVKDTGYCAVGLIRDYDGFPQCGYPWNGFLLEALISEYGLGFRVISPRVKDRRFQKGLIVPEDSRYNTFEELVVGLLKESGQYTIAKAGLTQFLRELGIINNCLPRELYKSGEILFKNESFVVKK